MTVEVPAAADRANMSPQRARRMVEAIFFAAPIVVGLVGILPQYIQQHRAGLALSVVLSDPKDQVVGRSIGEYLRGMVSSPVAPTIKVAHYESFERHLRLNPKATILDNIIWHLPNAVFAMHDESKIGMFKSAVQTPATECIDALLDSSHTISRTEYPSPDSVRRIGDLAVTLELIDAVGANSQEAAERSKSNTTQVLSACNLISGGMRDVIKKYIKKETVMKPESKELVDLVRDLSSIRTKLEQSDQVSGIPCAPHVAHLARDARSKLDDVKSSFIELENKITKPNNGLPLELTGVSRDFDKAKGLIDQIETHVVGILSTRAPTYEISSGSMFIGLVVWLIVVGGIYAKFTDLFSRKTGRPADTPPSSHAG